MHVEVRGQFVELVLSLHHMVPKNQTEVISHGNRCLSLVTLFSNAVIKMMTKNSLERKGL